MNANQVSELVGVSVRTLHHYDTMGILKPNRNPENGYREYTEHDLDQLQQVLFFKACGFPLASIRDLLCDPNFDRQTAFELQKKALQHERRRIDAMLKTLEKSIQNMKGQITMNQTEKFAGFDFTNNPYEAEARRIWGDDVIDKSIAHIGAMSEGEAGGVGAGMDALFRELAQFKDQDPSGPEVQQAMSRMYHFFNANFGYHYTPEAFAGLGQLYVEDQRFTKNIDWYGEGLSAFLSKAMKVYADHQ